MSSHTVLLALQLHHPILTYALPSSCPSPQAQNPTPAWYTMGTQQQRATKPGRSGRTLLAASSLLRPSSLYSISCLSALHNQVLFSPRTQGVLSDQQDPLARHLLGTMARAIVGQQQLTISLDKPGLCCATLGTAHGASLTSPQPGQETPTAKWFHTQGN